MVTRARFFLHQDLQTLKLIPLFKEDLYYTKREANLWLSNTSESSVSETSHG